MLRPFEWNQLRLFAPLLALLGGCELSSGVGALIEHEPVPPGPVVRIVSPEADQSVLQAPSIQLRGEVRHLERLGADGLTAEWFVDGVSACSSSAVQSDNSSNCQAVIAPGEHTVTLAAVNETGADAVTSHRFTVAANDAPMITITSPTSDILVEAGEAIVFSASVSDDHQAADTLLITWRSSIDGPLIQDGYADAEGRFTTVGALSEGEHLLTAQVQDISGYLGEDSLLLSVQEANVAPSIAAVAITPNPARVDEQLTCTYSGFVDLNGDQDASRLSWSIDGVNAGAGSTLSGGFVRGSEVACDVTPSDGRLDGATVSDTLVIENTPPVVSGLVITPTTPQTDDLVTCSYAYADADFDADDSEVVWLRNGLAQSTGSSYAGTMIPGDELTCQVTARDGLNDGNILTGSVIVGNYVPEVTDVRIAPEPAYVGDTLTCTYVFSDQDSQGDTSTIAWTVDGVLIGNLASVSTGFSPGDEVRCTVTPSDGFSQGIRLRRRLPFRPIRSRHVALIHHRAAISPRYPRGCYSAER